MRHKLQNIDSFIILLASIFVIGHILYINTHFLNFEFAFSEAAKSILHPEYKQGFKSYWMHQANPLGYSLITASLGLFLGLSRWVVRLPSLMSGAGILLVGLVFYKRGRSERHYPFYIWALATAFHPSIWTFSGRASTDVLTTFLIVCVFYLCHLASKKGIAFDLLGGFCFGLATLVKFNALLMFPGLLLLIITEGHKRIPLRFSIARLSCYLIFPALILGIYFVLIYQSFSILFIPDFQKGFLFEKSLNSVTLRFLSCMGHLTLFLGPLSLIPPVCLCRKGFRVTLLYIFVAAAITALIVSQTLNNLPRMEIGYGVFEHILSDSFRYILMTFSVFLGFLFFASLSYMIISKRDGFGLFILTTVFSYLLMIAFARPSDRYLIPCLPFLLYYVAVVLGSRWERMIRLLGPIAVSCFMVLSIASIAYQIRHANAIERMTDWISSRGYAKMTKIGSLCPHVAHDTHSIDVDPPMKYVVILRKVPHGISIHTEKVSILGIDLLEYSLCEASKLE